jgi:hypothetical protein
VWSVQKRVPPTSLPRTRTSSHVSLWNKLPFKSSHPPTYSTLVSSSSYKSLKSESLTHTHTHTHTHLSERYRRLDRKDRQTDTCQSKASLTSTQPHLALPHSSGYLHKPRARKIHPLVIIGPRLSDPHPFDRPTGATLVLYYCSVPVPCAWTQLRAEKVAGAKGITATIRASP